VSSPPHREKGQGKWFRLQSTRKMETDPNREWNGKEKEDGSAKDLCGVFHALNLGATP